MARPTPFPPPLAAPEEMHICDFLHAEPAEKAATDSAVHTVTAPIVDLHDEGTTAGTDLDGVGVYGKKKTAETNTADQAPTDVLRGRDRRVLTEMIQARKKPGAERSKEVPLPQLTVGCFLFPDQLCGEFHSSQRALLLPLPPGLLTGGIGVPGLPAMIAKFCLAILTTTNKPGAFSTAICNHGITGGGRGKKEHQLKNSIALTEFILLIQALFLFVFTPDLSFSS